MIQNSDNIHLLSDPKTHSVKLKQHGIPDELDFGPDWLGLSFNVNPNMSNALSPEWTVLGTGNPPEPDGDYEKLFMSMPFMNTNVEVRYFPRLLKCYLHFNPSTALYGKTAQIAPTGACVALVDKLLDVLQPFVSAEFDLIDVAGTITRASGWEHSVAITRLDPACNLYIDDTLKVKNALANSRPKNFKTRVVYETNKGGWGLESRTKGEGKDTIYDKVAELKTHGVSVEADPRGAAYRFETKLQRSRLKKCGFSSLADVTEKRVWEALEARWEASRWGVGLAEPGTISEALKGLKPSTQLTVLGYLCMAELGLEHALPASRKRNMSKLLDGLGLMPGMSTQEAGVVSRRLDLRKGYLVDVY